MFKYSTFLLLIVSVAWTNANTLQGSIDIKRLQTILEENVKGKDISTVYYALKGLKLLNAKIPDICKDIAEAKYDVENIEQVFHLTNAAQIVGCQNFLKPDVLAGPAHILDKKDVTISELYYAVYSLKALGKGSIYDREDALKNLIQMLKKDDTPSNYGYVFAMCEHMGCGAWTTTHAEGVLLAADESDSRALHFEGGLPTTAFLLSSIVRTYKSMKKPTPLTEEQRIKFAQYLVSRRTVNTAKGAALLLEAALAIADDTPSPIAIEIKGRKFITSEFDTIEFSITDVLGRPVRNLKPEEVVAQSGTRLADDVVVLSKQALTPSSPTTFVLNLNKIKAQYGLYKIALSASGKTTNVNVAVLGEIKVGNVEIGIGDVDGTTSPKITTVTYPNKLSEVLQADHLQKVTLKFSVRDAWGKPVAVHQAFVRVADDARETIFVAEPDNTHTYKLELNVGALARHVQHAAGVYSLTMYLGDSAVSNPVAWPLADLHLNLPADTNAVGEERVGAVRGGERGPLPEIRHEFRAPEPRPPRALSDVCACACAAPLLLLLALWARLGLNLANLPLSPSVPLFHLAMAGTFALYGMLWLQLSMFDTMRYLVPLAMLTFLSGHRLLRRLVKERSQR